MLDTKAYIVVGRPKTGKTTWTKAAVATIGRPVYVWDINGEWGQTAPDEALFVERAGTLRNSTIVWEEATTFLEHPSSKLTSKVRSQLSRRRHPGNTHFLLFTSLSAVPTKILNNADRIILFPTNDLPAYVEQKFRGWPSVVAGYREARSRPSCFTPVDVSIFGA
jgi:hypothetical protein